MRRGRRWPSASALRDAALTLGAVVGVVCLLATVACLVLGVRPMVVTSGSMSPAIPAGSLAFAQPQPVDGVRVGDVVTVDTGRRSRVMHRVVAVAPAGSRTALTLKGDANATPDARPYVVDRVGAVRLHVPWLGYPVSWLSTPWGLVGLGTLAAALLFLAFRRDPRPPGGRRRAVAAVALPVTLGVAVSATAGPASAWFSDADATVSSDPFVTHRVVSQAQPACQNVNGLLTGDLARLTWTHVDGRYEYRWELRSSATSPAVVSSGTLGGGQAVGTTVTLDLTAGMASADANYNLVVRARLRSATGWVAENETSTPVRRESPLLAGNRFRCGHV